MSCFEDIRWIEFFEQFSRIFEIPIKDREWPESTRKPCIEDVGISYDIFFSVFRLEFARIFGNSYEGSGIF